ncbi:MULTISPECIES: prolyl oligopeptidase family serine peptidase [unclassified Pseudomonas]|uniref:prolyl oligopeptidase family serine peptidase n=1 Tax=unclassified Pseudomonas TaxID=196821 RepID=UPI000BD4D9FB|nr:MULTISPECIES: prolyl oligopeptidase family serine peptidase [unclassified Pseudomonas]PVZ20222.1 oligopeptidase B [Pseudomonas sp. URIL14HWK12:I12]PVZ27288.1 oligopeptidase B [Pseudomonas sp. URIL14HWK12:I10]PVZ38177.1 oligopeptidase B [Pseudomonas sp. URIL14HWK12:I11]SNZ04329.1 oligopeptidase B [Pseudomonas sp. URIL14HWK12:I9]
MPTAPIAAVAPGNDPYAWLRHDQDAAKAYLAEENAFYQATLASTEALQEQLLREFEQRQPAHAQPDLGLVVGPWIYYQQQNTDEPYPKHYRRPSTAPQATGQLLLDVNTLAEGDHVDVRQVQASPDHRYLAYSLASDGSQRYRIHIKDLSTGHSSVLPGPDSLGLFAWGGDSQSILYITLANDGWRPAAFYRFTLGDEQPVKVLDEHDQAYLACGCQRSASGSYLIMGIESPSSSEAWVIDAYDLQAPPVRVRPRAENARYYVDHGCLNGAPCWFMRDHASALDGEVRYQWSSPGCPPDPAQWSTLIAARPGVVLTELYPKRTALVLSLREQGLTQLEVHRFEQAPCRVTQAHASYKLQVTDTLDFEQPRLRMTLESFTLAEQTWELDLDTLQCQLLQQVAIGGSFDSGHYRIQRLWAVASDGTEVPISLAYRVDAQFPAPTLLSGYGAYNISEDPSFQIPELSLLDRGYVLAIAHVRGGGMLGPHWHQAGRLGNKPNTFADFIACAEHLIAQGFTEPARLAIQGKSAGGLLVGAVLNQRPDLFAAAIAQVPFVDVLNSMLDDSLPLTIPDYAEWGNPQEPDAHTVIASYAPYENVSAQAYPALMVTAGFNDPLVPYWEPAKWVAKLRALKTNDRWLVFHTDMGGGHADSAAQDSQQRLAAQRLAFLMTQLDRA